MIILNKAINRLIKIIKIMISLKIINKFSIKNMKKNHYN